MKKWIKFILSLFLLPLCWALSRMLFSLLQSLSVGSGWSAWAIPMGFIISTVGFFILPRPFRTYVLAHELTHAIWGMLMGAKVGNMKINPTGGHVMLSKSNFIISLAPYFFPFYTSLVIVLWLGIQFFWDVSDYTTGWLVAVGLTWGFHITFTLYMLSQRQPDVQENGRLFSYVIIYLANLLFVVLWIIAVGAPTVHNAWECLRPEALSAYRWTGKILYVGWDRLKSMLPILN